MLIIRIVTQKSYKIVVFVPKTNCHSPQIFMHKTKNIKANHFHFQGLPKPIAPTKLILSVLQDVGSASFRVLTNN